MYNRKPKIPCDDVLDPSDTYYNNVSIMYDSVMQYWLVGVVVANFAALRNELLVEWLHALLDDDAHEALSAGAQHGLAVHDDLLVDHVLQSELPQLDEGLALHSSCSKKIKQRTASRGQLVEEAQQAQDSAGEGKKIENIASQSILIAFKGKREGLFIYIYEKSMCACNL
jgi:hypothetical protein